MSPRQLYQYLTSLCHRLLLALLDCQKTACAMLSEKEIFDVHPNIIFASNVNMVYHPEKKELHTAKAIPACPRYD